MNSKHFAFALLGATSMAMSLASIYPDGDEWGSESYFYELPINVEKDGHKAKFLAQYTINAEVTTGRSTKTDELGFVVGENIRQMVQASVRSTTATWDGRIRVINAESKQTIGDFDPEIPWDEAHHVFKDPMFCQIKTIDEVVPVGASMQVEEVELKMVPQKEASKLGDAGHPTISDVKN